VQKNMITGFTSIFPSEYSSKAAAALQYRDAFHLSINVHCNTLAQDFKEDLQFRFSLGLTNIIRRVAAFSRQRAAEHRAYAIRTGELKETDEKKEDEGKAGIMNTIVGVAETHDDDVLLRSLVLSSAAYLANGGIGILLIGGLVYRTVGIRPILIGTGVYGGLYAWERFRWNIHAKEAQLKRQLRQHLQLKLRLLQPSTTAHCDTQVQREVGEVLSRLRATASEVHRTMKNDVDTLQGGEQQLKVLVDTLNHYKGQATFLNSEIDNFETTYL